MAKDLRGTADATLRRLRAAAANTTPRERRLAAVLGFVALGAATFQAFAFAADQRDRELAAAADLQLRRQTAALGPRTALSAAERAELAALASRALVAPDLWIARVRIEQQLAGAARAAGVVDPRIEVEGRLDDTLATPAVRAEIAGAYGKPAFVRLMAALQAAPQAAHVERIRVEASDNPQFRLTLLYPVRTMAPPPPATEPAT